MNQKGFANIIVIIGVVILVGVAGYFIVNQQKLSSTPTPSSTPSPTSALTPIPTPSPSRKPTPQSTSFNLIFRYGVGAKNELNTFDQTYTKDMVLDPSVTIKFKLTDNELSGIYQKINDLKLFDKNEERTDGNMLPCSSYYLKVQIDSIQKELSWNCRGKISDKLQQFTNYIIPIIESKQEYKELPTPKGGYL